MIRLNIIYIPQNKGLGNALREAVNHSSNSLIARMDSDDISIKDRFRLQLEKFMCMPELDVVGGNISEFVGSEANITGIRAVPETDFEIKNYIKKRCPLNHMSVMFKKSSVQDAGGYLDWYCNEDYYLWIRMIENGCKFENLQECLVNVRTGIEMSKRRGGKKYFESEKKLQYYMLSRKMIGYPRYIYNILTRFTGEVVLPDSLRAKAFRFLRKPYIEIKSIEINEKRTNIQTIKSKKQYPSFSVAMSVYGKDNAEWLDKALESITINQTIKPNEVVLVVDGPVPGCIQKVIEKYTQICREINC